MLSSLHDAAMLYINLTLERQLRCLLKSQRRITNHTLIVRHFDMEDKLRSLLLALYKTHQCHPLLVRLAWHDAGTFCAKSGTGGANGSIRFQPEAGHGANKGLALAHKLIAEIKSAVPEVSYADLYQLAGVVAIEFAGGPKIPFRFGRVDADGPDQCTEVSQANFLHRSVRSNLNVQL